MKQTILTILISAVLLLALTACTNATGSSDNKQSSALPSSSQTDTNTANANKSLIVFFSQTGTTERVAKEIQQQTGADLFRILNTTPYPDDYNTLSDQAQSEQENNARPTITGTVSDMAQYKVVYVGFPIWWGDMPMILYSFFDAYDLSGKTIIPFVTSGGSGFANTLSAMKSLEPNATFLDGLSLSSAQATDCSTAVSDWLTKNGQK